MIVHHDIRGRVRRTPADDGQVVKTQVVASVEQCPIDLRSRALVLRSRGYSVRHIARLLAIPRSTVGDWVKADHDSMPQPEPFYLHVDF